MPTKFPGAAPFQRRSSDDAASFSSSSTADDEAPDFTQEDKEWQDVDEEQGEDLTYISLFDEKKFSTLDDMLLYCKEKHEMDFGKVVTQLGGCVYPSRIA